MSGWLTTGNWPRRSACLEQNDKEQYTWRKPVSVSRVPISGTDKTLSFETGKLAQLADGAVVARIGDTVVLVTANAAKGVREGIDFFPLTVDVEERMYAAGKIPGSFFRREGRPTDQAILTCRLIDRPLRPSFPDGFRNEIQVVATILGADQENPHDVLAINGASAALMLSGIPFEGPIGAVRMAFTTDGTWVPHPTYQEGDESTFELVVAGRALDDGDVAIMMVEAGGTEDAWTLLPGRRAQGHRGGHRRRPRGGQGPDQGVHRPPARAGRRRPAPSRPISVRDPGRLRRRRLRPGGRGRHRPGDRRRRRSSPRPSATPPPTRRPPPSSPQLGAEFEGAEKADQGRGPLAHQEARAQAHRRRRRAHRRSWPHRHPAAVGRGRPHPHRPRLRPVPAGRDPGAQRRHARHAPHGADARHHRHRRHQALHAPLQHAALRHRRDRVHAAARSAARSATACWPSGPCCPSCPPVEEFPYTLRLVSECCRPTARPRWRRCAARPCR